MNDDTSRVHEIEREVTTPPLDQKSPQILALLTPPPEAPEPPKAADIDKVTRLGRLVHDYMLGFIGVFVLFVGLVVFVWPHDDKAGGLALYIYGVLFAIGLAILAIPLLVVLIVYVIKSRRVSNETGSRTLTLPMAISLVFLAFILLIIGWFLYGVYGPGN